MNTQFLGDALDHWKGSLISILRNKKIFRKLAVEPMITDDQPWQPQDLQTYTRILNLGQHDTVCHTNTTFRAHNINRQDYFGQIPNDCDLFLDPDTGIASEGGNRKHIRIREILRLLNGDSTGTRLLMVYQHLARTSSEEQRQIIQNRLDQLNRRACYCVYQSRQAAMLFISRNKKRIRNICRTLKDCLTGTAAVRIWP
jgi:hypothetical protein